MVLEKTFESPLGFKEIKPVNPKGNQSWIFIGRTDAEAQILWPADARSQLFGKDPDWEQKEKRASGDEIAGWHHWHMDTSLSKLQEMVKQAWHAAVHGSQRAGHDWATEQQPIWLLCSAVISQFLSGYSPISTNLHNPDVLCQLTFNDSGFYYYLQESHPLLSLCIIHVCYSIDMTGLWSCFYQINTLTPNFVFYVTLLEGFLKYFI